MYVLPFGVQRDRIHEEKKLKLEKKDRTKKLQIN